jgi:hypothetical protein
MFVPDRTRRVVVRQVEEGSKCRTLQRCKVNAQDAERPWGGHGKGRRAAAGVGSSYLVRRDLLTSGLHSQPFAALAGLLALAGTTATGRALEHWLDGGGSFRAKQARECEQGWACRPGGEGGFFVSVHSIPLRCARRPS